MHSAPEPASEEPTSPAHVGRRWRKPETGLRSRNRRTSRRRSLHTWLRLGRSSRVIASGRLVSGSSALSLRDGQDRRPPPPPVHHPPSPWPWQLRRHTPRSSS